jgi:hypothetical protein
MSYPSYLQFAPLPPEEKPGYQLDRNLDLLQNRTEGNGKKTDYQSRK